MPSLATTTQSVAIIAATAALLGGVLGAIAGGLSDYFLERRREQARARAGARLLRSDLRVAAGRLGTAIESSSWLRVWDPSVECWDEYRDVLAISLGPSAWDCVEKAVSRIRQIDGNVSKAIAGAPLAALVRSPVEAKLEPAVIPGLRLIRENARSAYNALAQLAEGELADETFGAALPRPAAR